MRDLIAKIVREAFYDTCGPGYKSGFSKAHKGLYWNKDYQVSACCLLFLAC